MVSLQEAFTVRGHWWFPGADESRFPGTLQFSPREGGVLTLTLPLGDMLFGWPMKEHPVIYGVAETSASFTLLGCFDTRHRSSDTGVSTTHIHVNRLLRGRRVVPPEELRLRRSSFRFDTLYSWTGETGFKIVHSLPALDYQVTYRPPAPISCTLDETWTLELMFGPRHILAGPDPSGRCSLEERAWVRLSTTEPAALMDHLDAMTTIQNLLSLASRTPTSVVGAQVEIDDEDSAEDCAGCFELFFATGEPTEKIPSHHTEFLFVLRDVRDRFEQFLRAWWQDRVLLEPVFDLYNQVLQARRRYSVMRFLNLAQALEVLHRRTRGGSAIDPTQYREVILPEILKHVSPHLDAEEASGLKGHLEWLHEPSMRRRVRECYASNETAMDALGFKRKAFAQSAVGLRNAFTHYSESEQRTRFDKDSIQLTSGLQSLLEACLLERFGFDEADRCRRILRMR
jgi:hypothetical protein